MEIPRNFTECSDRLGRTTKHHCLFCMTHSDDDKNTKLSRDCDHFFKEKFNSSLSLRQVEMNSRLAPLGKRKAGLSGIVTLILSAVLTGSTGSSPAFADLFYQTDEFLSPSLSFSSA